jgi:4-methyl-5(b-hydroxyethyl)-thiazole monophosphate biosynthesis
LKQISISCASPAVVLQAHGLLNGKLATCHPNFEAMLTEKSAIAQRVVVSGNLITSRGPGEGNLFFFTFLIGVLFRLRLLT